MASDDYICVVARFPRNSVYRYSVKGSVYQYHDVAYLNNLNLCTINGSLTEDVDGVSKTIAKSLDRPFGSIFSPSEQNTCVLVTIKSACPYTTCTFGLKWCDFNQPWCDHHICSCCIHFHCIVRHYRVLMYFVFQILGYNTTAHPTSD